MTRIDPRTQLVACPYCRAHVDQPCRTRSGHHATKPHSCRLTPRLCPCGEPPAPYRYYCDQCRDEARHESQSAYARRRRTNDREAV